jgi:trk system potassium uptake protein TrkA
VSPNLLVVVVGCGRLGSILADTLSGQGASVVVVDQSEAAMARLSGAFSGFRILGDASEVSVLREAGVDRADFVIAATDRDNLNLFVALAAKELFGTSRVAARLFDPTREPVFDELDIPDRVMSRQVFDSRVRPRRADAPEEFPIVDPFGPVRASPSVTR